MIRTKLTDMFRFFENNKFIGKMSKVAKSVALAFAIILPLGNAMAETSVTYCVNGDRKVNVYADSGYSSYYFSLNGGPKIYAGASATFAFEMPEGFAMPAEGSIKVYGGETELTVTVKPYTITATITLSDNSDGSVKLTAGSTMGIDGDAVVTYSWYLFDSSNNNNTEIKTAVGANNKATAFGYTKSSIGGNSAEITSQTIEPCGQWVALILENKGCCYDTTFAFVVPQPICPAGFKTTETLTTTSTATDCKASGLTIPTFNACSYAWKKGSQSGTGSTGVSDLLFSDGESITWTLTNGTASTTKTQTCTTTVSIKDATVPLCPNSAITLSNLVTSTGKCVFGTADVESRFAEVSLADKGTDNCSLKSAAIDWTQTSVSEFTINEDGSDKSYTIYYKLTDNSDNQSKYCSAAITVKDGVTPVISLSSGSEANNHDFACSSPVAPVFMLTDDCKQAVELASTYITEGTETTNGCVHSKTWTANYTDAKGHAAEPLSVTYNWTVATAPIIATIPAQNAIAKEMDCKYIIPDLSAVVLANSTDPCGGTLSFVSQNIAKGTEYVQTNEQQTIEVTVMVEGTCGLTQTATVNVIIPANDLAVTEDLSVHKDVSCFGGSDGSFTLKATGGLVPYYFSGDGSGFKKSESEYSTFEKLNAGSYSVEVKDDNGCLTRKEVTITQPEKPLAVEITVPEAACPGENYTFTTTVEGGTPGYTYAWSGDASGTADTYTLTSDVTSEKTYTATVTVTDAHSCTAEATEKLTVEDKVAPSVVGTAKSISIDGCTSADLPAFATTIADLERTTGLTFSDNCTAHDGLTVSHDDDPALTGSCAKTLTRTYYVSDKCGNKTTVEQTITLNMADFTIPTEDVEVESTIKCLSEVKVPTLPTVVNACNETLSPVLKSGYPTSLAAGACEGDIVYVYTYSDCTGEHSHDWTYTYHIVKHAPVIASEGKATSQNISCIAEDVALTEGQIPTATNDCGETVTPTVARTTDWTGGKENCTGKIIYTYTYTDCGKSSEWVFTYNLKNEVVPTISTNLTNSSKECNWDGKDAPVVADFTVTDNCKSDAKVTLVAGEIITNDCSRSQTWTATYTNACGVNAESKTITYTWIEDHENPTITSSVSTTNAVNAGECKYQVPNVIALATIHDNCTTDEKLNISQNPVAGTYITENTDVTITVVDGCNNTSTKTITVNLPAVLDATITSSESFCYNTADGIIEGTISNGVAPYVVEWSGAASGSLNNQNDIHIDNLPDGNYTVKVTDANGCSIEKTATIAQLTQTITVTAKSAEQIYNGESLSKNEYEVSGTLETGDVIADVVISGSRTDVGISANVVESFKIMRGAQDVTCYYDTAMRNSTLEVKCRPITITAATKEFKYDGTVHSDAGYKVVGLVRPDTLSAVVEGSIQYVSESPVINVLKSYTFTTGKESNYCVTKENGTLTMKYECQNITIAANSNSWTYDGQSHSEDGYTLTIGTGEGAPTYTVGADGVYTFANGDVLTVDVTGSITNVSQTPVENVASVVSILNGSEDVKDAYCITNNKGTLSVTKASLNITINDTKIYDGMPLVTPITKATATGLVEGDALQAGEVRTDGKDVKTYQYSESSIISTAYTTTKGIENYDVTYNLTQNITKRPITFTSATAEKVYDGTELTKHEVYVSGDGLVQNETVSFDVTGTITNVGFVPNTFDYSWGEGVNAENYNVTKKEGTLKITENTSKIVITSLDYSWTYNCGNHTYERYEVTYDGNPVIEVSSDGKTFTLPTGDKLTITSTISGVKYVEDNEANNNTFSYTIENSENYNAENISSVFGTISITKRNLKLTANSDEKPYDGTALVNSGYTIDPVDNLASCDRIESVSVVGSQLNVGNSENKISNVVIKSADKDVTDNYNVSYVDGELSVTPIEITVEIVGNSSVDPYDGESHTVSGYVVKSISNELFKESDIVYDGNNNSASRTDEGTTNMGLSAANFSVTNPNFTNVEFVVTDGYQKIEKIDVDVIITKHGKTEIYDGMIHGVDGYDFESSTPLYKRSDLKYIGESADTVTSGIDVGMYGMKFDKNSFENTNPNFSKVNITMVEDSLEIVSRKNVIVTITEHADTFIYDGNDHTVTGYEVSISDPLYTESDFIFKGDSSITGNEEGEYSMPVVADSFVNINNNFADVQFVIVPDTMLITPRENVIVTITKHSDTVTYDGKEHTVSGYEFESSDPLYIEDYIEFLGTPADSTAKGTTIGSYGMNFDDTSFVNTNKNFKDVEFVVNSADSLVIEALGGVIVTITEHADTFIYDGNDHTVTGYEVSISDPLYTESDFIFKGDSSITGNEEGEYSMPVVADSFVNINDNFADVQFVIVPDTMLITPRENVIVTITKHSETVTYDGEEHTVSGYDFESSDPLYIEDYIDFLGEESDSIAKGTTIGSYGMNFDDTSFVNTNKNFKDVKFVVNSADSLRIEALGGVIVTITEHADTFIYDGNDHTVTGYEVSISDPLYTESDYIFKGDSSITGNEEGEYSMPVVADSFVNINENFADVQFIIVPDTMLITPRENVIVTITKHSDTVTYDGKEHTVSGYDFKSSDPLYIENYIDFLGEPSDSIARGTTIGSYGMNFDDTSFVNTNKNFKDVKFVVNSADSLVIEALGGVIVTITEHADTFIYDGNDHTVTGYEVSISDPLYTESDFIFKGDSSITGNEEGEYSMPVIADSFVNINNNFVDVQFVIVPDTMLITPRENVIVTITKHSDVVTYDGEEHMISGYDFESSDPLYIEGYISFLGTEEDSIARGTTIGSYGMNFDDTSFVNTNKNFKDVKFVVNSADSLVIEALGGVEVTITKHSDVVTFDGEEHMVSGYDFVSSDPLYIEDYISFLGNPSDSIASGTTAGSYGMNFDDTSFVNTNPNFKDVKFIVKNADSLVIEPRGGVEVTITKHSDAVTFDGKEHIVSGYDFSSNDTLYVEEFIQFLGTVEDSIARGTEVGSYGMNFDDTSFVNTNPNFKDVTFIVNDADSLMITPRKDVIVTIIPHSGIEKYTKATYTVEGYEVEISDSLYTEDDFSFSGVAKVSNREVGEYPMVLANEDFTNLNKNFNVTFDIKEGGLTITKNDTVIVYVYEGGRIDTYDGKRHEVTEFRYKTNNNFYSYSDVKRKSGVSYVASGTEVGSYRMNLQPEYFENKNANYENVQFVIIPDSLVILPRTDVHVTIIPTSDTILYDGEEHIVRGYEFIATDSLFSETDFIFSGVDSMSVVDAGEYELILSESDFQQSNNNFGIVSFEVEKGHKTIINPIDLVNVYISENIDTFVYDGIEKSVTGYHVDSIDNVLYKESDFVFNGVAEISASDAGRYSMNLNSSDFENKNTNFKEIQFIIQHDSMVIEPMRGVEVTIVAHGDTFEFDGRAHSVSGYEVIANSELYQRDFINFRGDSIVTATEVGEYSMELTADDFQNTNPNFEDVVFTVDNDNQLIIESLGGVQVVLKKHGDVLSYNGTEQRVTGYDLVSISDTLYTADDFNFIGTESDTVAARTTIGTAVMSLSADDFQNNNATFEDVRFIVLDDTLTIVPNDHEIVTIHEGAQLVPFDGEEHMVTGFSFTSTDGAYTENSFIFNGKDTVYGKEVGAYSMNLQPENFTNIDSNYVNVTFVIEHDSLAIVPLQAIVVTIYEHADTLVFNGKEQIVSGYDIESSISYYDAKDFDFVGDSVVSMINTGDYKMNLKVSDFHNTNENFTDVTFKVVPAVSRIEPKDTLHVTIYGSIDSVYYNGKYQEVTGYTVKPEEGFEFYKEFKFTGNETATGIRVGTYTMGMKASDFTNTSKNYKKVIFDVIDGYIFIDKVAVPIIITANSNSKVYDGTPLIAQGYSYTKNALQKGDDIRATIEGTITNVGTVENRVVSYKIVRGSEDVTSNYNFGHTEDGTLTILPRKVSLTSASDSKEYDGTPLTNDSVTVGEKGWAKGEGATYHVTGSQTQLGSSANTFDYELFENTLASNYEIVKEEGTLTVGTNTGEVIITAVTDTFLYDGKEHTGRFSVSGLIGKGDSLVVELSGALTDAGTVENKVVSYQVIRGAEDVTDNYTFGPSVDGKIVVTPRKVTLISASAEQEYNGQELTNDTVVAGGDGWAAGEGATYTVTGSRLYVGDTINTFTYELNDNTKADNYIITKEEGVLSVFVNTQLIEITAASNKKEYDGTPLEDSTYTFTEGVLAEGDELIVIVKGSITEVGRTTNEVDSFRIMRGDVDVTNCYNVETYKGELVVTESSHHPFVIVGNDHAIEMYNVNNVVRVYDMLGRMIKINGAFEAHVGEYYKLEVMNPGVYVVYVNDDETGYKVIVR